MSDRWNFGERYWAHEIRVPSDDIIIRWKDCPHCDGRGWWLDNPFKEYNKITYQCKTCLESKAYFDKHGTVPPTPETPK